MDGSGNKVYIRLCLLLILASFNRTFCAQDRKLVWQDEFDGTSIDLSTWTYESGPTNDNVHYYTSRAENARIEGGILKIIALNEAYQGYEYTSALIKTEKSLNWKYGRIEARIKLPGTPGFVPAFWMLPAGNRYGWWPSSGEIDIMEHPTNSVTGIYGTIHSEYYNLFDGPFPPQGGMLDIGDAETAFHLYAIEWTEDQIDFFVDDQKYFTFSNDLGSSVTWPFDEPFYIILNLAVGGGWVGTPDESSVFPAVMEVDYVRVYQNESQASILGEEYVPYNHTNATYSVPEFEGATYQWEVPGDALIQYGQGSPRIGVNWGLFGGDVEAEITTNDGSFVKSLPVRVSSNLIRNPGFENGVRYWDKAAAYPAQAALGLTSEEAHGGGYSLLAEISETGANAWDVQLSQGDLVVQAGTTYQVNFWGMSPDVQESFNAAILNTSNFDLIASEPVTLDKSWKLLKFEFTPPANATIALNLDLGDWAGSFYFDDFNLTTRDLSEMNLLKNPDFFDGEFSWNLFTLSTAQASGIIDDGAYSVSITDGGENAWDIHMGQTGLLIETGKEYSVSFDARSDAPRQISAFVGKDSDPWTLYSGTRDISVTSSWQTYTYSFTMNEPTDPQSRLGFDIGGDPNDVSFDNVLLRKGGAVTVPGKMLAEEPAGHSLTIYPNPSSGQATFQYLLHEPSYVTLKIYSPAGREVATLVHEVQGMGGHQVIWNAWDRSSGIYIYVLQTGGNTRTGKLVIF